MERIYTRQRTRHLMSVLATSTALVKYFILVKAKKTKSLHFVCMSSLAYVCIKLATEI